MQNPFSLEGKTIIVTGASSGIGKRTAIECARVGARVILIGRNMERLTQTELEIGIGSVLEKKCLDLTDYSDVDIYVQQLKDCTTQIDGIIHSAGRSTTLPFIYSTEEKFLDFFQSNVLSALALTRMLLKKKVLAQGSSIVFIASVMSEAGEVGKSLYSSTKAALNGLSKSLALEFAKREMRVNCISPGVVETPMSQNAVYSHSDESIEMVKLKHPLGIGKPEDVAYGCVYLLSDASRWVTGTNLIIDGGYLAK